MVDTTYRTTRERRMVQAYVARAALVAIGVAALFLLSVLGQARGESVTTVAQALAPSLKATTIDMTPEGPLRAPRVSTHRVSDTSDADDEDNDDEGAAGRDELAMATAVDTRTLGAPCKRTCLGAESPRVKWRHLTPDTPPPRS